MVGITTISKHDIPCIKYRMKIPRTDKFKNKTEWAR